MKVKVRYFASIREKLNRSEEEIELEDNATLNTLIYKLYENPKTREILFSSKELKNEVTIAHNAKTIKRDEINKIILKDNDVVAFFPIISAG